MSRALLALAVALLISTSTAAQEPTLHEGLIHRKLEDVELALDLLEPPRTGEPRAVVLCIHGGGWRQGSRQQMRSSMAPIAAAGMVAISPSYRFSDVAPWPAQWEDLRAAMDWIREHAEEYQLDPERLGAIGPSAGGHLSLLCGLRHAAGHRARARTVVNLFGPTQLASPAYPDRSKALITQLLGGAPDQRADAARDASPMSWINHGDASILSYHGTADPLVPYAEATALHAALEQAGVPHRLITAEGVGHTIDPATADRTGQTLLEHLRHELAPTTMPLVAAEDFEADDLAERWTYTDAEAWERRPAAPPADLQSTSPATEPASDQHVLALHRKKSNYSPPVRSPLHQALLKGSEVGSFVLDLWVQSTHPDYGHRDLCLFFGHQSPSRFYYVHLGQEADPHAHSIFLVNDAARVSIAQERTDGTPWDHHWHRVRIVREVDSGLVEVYFDDLRTPIMKTVDHTFTHGRIGVGSFDDTGNFDALRLWGERAEAPARAGDDG